MTPLLFSVWCAVAPPCATVDACQADCEASDEVACFRLGQLRLTTNNISAAIGPTRRACNLGHAAACRVLGVLVFEGKGVERAVDDGQAFLQRACTLGDIEGCGELARRAPGVMSPIALLKKATEGCARKLADSCALAGRMLIWGSAGAQEVSTARALFANACTGGVAQACAAERLCTSDDTETNPSPDFGLPGAPSGPTAHLSVDSSAGARVVLIDGMQAGVTPLQLDAAVGRHVVQLFAEGRKVHAQRVELSAGARLSVSEVVPIRMAITCNAPQARVSVDGKPTEWSPGTMLHVSEGDHVVRVEAPGYEPESRTLTCRPGAACESAFVLTAHVVKVPIRTTPAGAEVQTSSGPAGLTPVDLPLAPGTSLTVKLEGYEAATVRVPPTGGVDVLLKPLPIRLTVDSEPQRAALRIDSAEAGSTPWTGGLPPGTYAVTLDKPGYEPVHRTIVLSAGQRSSVETARLEPLPAGVRLELSERPEDMVIKVDGAVVEAHDGVYPTGPGRHDLTLEAPTVWPTRTTVNVSPGQVAVARVSVRRRPRPPTQVVSFSVTPADAEVLVDDVLKCTGSCQVELELGARSVVARRVGYSASAARLDIKKGKPLTQALVLAPLPTSIAVESTPSAATVFVDGTQRGVTPFMLNLESGRHRVYVTKEGFASDDHERTVSAGAQETWRVNLNALAPPPPLVVAELPPPPPPAPPLRAPEAPQTAQSSHEVMLAALADPAGDVAAKRAILNARSHAGEDVSALVTAVQPEALRDELCVEFASHVRPLRMVAELVDGFGDRQQGYLFINGRRFGVLPFDGIVPWCTISIEGALPVPNAPRVKWGGAALDMKAVNTVVIAIPGRQARSSVMAFGELALSASASLPSELAADLSRSNWGAGARLDYWGKVLHVSVAVKASSLFRLGFLRDASAAAAPMADLFVGLGTGTTDEGPTRLRFAFDAGLWSLVCPSLRMTLALSFGEHFFIALSGDAHVVLPLFVKNYPAVVNRMTATDLLLFGGGLALGAGW